LELSIVICVKDDQDAFAATLKSLRPLPCGFYEVIVSDSSKDAEQSKKAINQAALKAQITYLWNKPRGIYPAINAAIPNAKGQWILILHSADLLLPHFIDQMVDTLRSCPEDILIYQVVYMRDGEYIYTEKSSVDSMLWPHQATFVRKSVYDEAGLYDERYRFAADQFFFHTVRDRYRCRAEDPILVAFDVSGVSASLNFRVLKEASLLHRLYGRNLFQRFLFIYLRALVRRGIEFFISPRLYDTYWRWRHDPVPDYLKNQSGENRPIE